MITVNQWFDKVLWIGSVNRPDRAAQMLAQFAKFDIQAEKFEAHWKPLDANNRPSSNFGCTASHRGCLELIAHSAWGKTLILEDDATILSDDFPEQFDAVVREMPDAWDFFFLGASYAEPPKRRFSGSLIETNGLMTTSSYGITCEMARKMAPHISGNVGIDSLYHHWQRTHRCLIASPRLIVQRPGFSDIQEKDADNSHSMQDTAHEEMLIEGEWLVGFGEHVFHGPLMRRELSEAAQMVGELVIVGDRRFTVLRVELPDHRMPWFAGEMVTYFLKPEAP